MQSRGTLTLTLSLSQRERGTFGGTVSGSPNRDPRRVRSSSPLPARSGERIKVRGASDCILTANSPLKKPPGEGTGPTIHADFRRNLVGRVPSRGGQTFLNGLLRRS